MAAPRAHRALEEPIHLPVAEARVAMHLPRSPGLHTRLLSSRWRSSLDGQLPSSIYGSVSHVSHWPYDPPHLSANVNLIVLTPGLSREVRSTGFVGTSVEFVQLAL